MGYNPVTSEAVLLPYFGDTPATYMDLSEAMSSPMLLYHLRCLLPSCEVEQGGGKGVWTVTLWHKRTHCQAGFGDHNSAATVCGDLSLKKDGAARQALQDLIKLLCSDRCPQTYDGLVAGCIA